MKHHNHNADCAPVGNTTGFDTVQRRTDPALLCFEQDTGWFKTAGLDPIAMLKRYPERFRMVHLKDIKRTMQVTNALKLYPDILDQGMLDWDINGVERMAPRITGIRCRRVDRPSFASR